MNKTMILFEDIVITSEKVDIISNLLDGTDFHGVDYEKGVSLFMYGFVYDGRTNTLISTHTIDVWNSKLCPMTFGVVELTLDKIDDVFNKHSEQILSDNDLTLSEWDELCDSYKINLIEISTGGLNIKGMLMDKTVEDLIEYLKTKID